MNEYPWLDRASYPFKHHMVQIEDGCLHYIDEGAGAPIVFVHGTPVWSFLYRRFVEAFSDTYRCIAPDHLGFGLSDKPAHASYKPADQSRRFAQFIDSLGLDSFTLVVHDFGGPFALPYALDHPERINRLVLFNTWLWSQADDPNVVRASKLFGGSLGRFLYTRLNLSPRHLYPLVFGDKSKFRRDVQEQYVRTTSTPDQRLAMWACAREILGSSEWYDQQWQRRDQIKDIPTLVLWGMKDPAFSPRHLARWQALFNNSTTKTFPDSGHFVQEEQPEPAISAIRSFLAE